MNMVQILGLLSLKFIYLYITFFQLFYHIFFSKTTLKCIQPNMASFGCHLV